MSKNILGKNISKFRKQLGMSQTDLANKTNLTTRAIAYYENEANNEIFTKLEIIAKALNVKLSDLFNNNDSDNNDEINIEKISTKTLKKLKQIRKLPKKDQTAIWNYIDYRIEKSGNHKINKKVEIK